MMPRLLTNNYWRFGGASSIFSGYTQSKRWFGLLIPRGYSETPATIHQPPRLHISGDFNIISTLL